MSKVYTILPEELNARTKHQEGNMSHENQHDVLFQKLGNTWYVFSEVNGELVFSEIPEGIDPNTNSFELYEVVEDHIERNRRAPDLAA